MVILNLGVPSGLRALSLLVLFHLVCLSSGAAVQPRDSVPAGYVAAPYYPTPYGGWADDWTDAYTKAAALVQKMTLAEKTNISSGTGIYMG